MKICSTKSETQNCCDFGDFRLWNCLYFGSYVINKLQKTKKSQTQPMKETSRDTSISFGCHVIKICWFLPIVKLPYDQDRLKSSLSLSLTAVRKLKVQ